MNVIVCAQVQGPDKLKIARYFLILAIVFLKLSWMMEKLAKPIRTAEYGTNQIVNE